MENNLVIGILNIFEDKLREFGIQIPDDDREDSEDPIVGYQYAELHDRVMEYLEDQGVIKDPAQELYDSIQNHRTNPELGDQIQSASSRAGSLNPNLTANSKDPER